MAEPIENLLSQRILLLDGGMGTMIKSYNLKESDFRGERFANHQLNLKNNNDLLSITQPGIIFEIHNAFLDAGSDIIETNTFSSTSVSQADYELEDIVYELNYEATKIAREAADVQTRKTPKKPRFVAGALGPTNRRATVSPDKNDPGFRNINFDALVKAYSEALHGLVEGGVDLLLVETIFDTLNSKAAIYAINKYFDDHNMCLPVMISGTITDTHGKTLSGQLPEAFWNSVAHAKPISVGFNCALGADELRHHIQTISAIVNVNVSVYPNAGHPNDFGEYDHTPQQMAALLCEFAESGFVNIVGGCCGTTPDHIRAIANAISNKTPRALPLPSPYCRLSGLEPLNFSEGTKFIDIEEHINVSNSSNFARLNREDKLVEALYTARTQVNGGAKIINVNLDDASLDGEGSMIRFLNLIAAEPDISRVPVILESSQFSMIKAGLKCLQGKGVANAISLKEGTDTFTANALEVLRLGAAVVVLAFDEDGEANSYQRLIDISKRTYKILTETVGFVPENIILDANMFPIITGDGKNKNLSSDFIYTVDKFKRTFPKVLVKHKKKIF
jgi:5-methyltetrahydrofolate--homocysteine methyltransferase